MITDCHTGVWFALSQKPVKETICWHHLSEDTANQICAKYCTVGPFLLQQRADVDSVNLPISVRGEKLSMQIQPALQITSLAVTNKKLSQIHIIFCMKEPHHLALVVRQWCHSTSPCEIVCCSKDLVDLLELIISSGSGVPKDIFTPTPGGVYMQHGSQQRAAFVQFG